MAIIALNIGCGNDYRKSTDEIKWVNADNGNCKVDLFLNIELPQYYFTINDRISDDYFNRIDAIQVLEHIHKENFFPIVRELYRISKDSAIWNIAVPHGLSDNFVTDPTHFMQFSTRTFDYFIDGTPLRENGIIYGLGDIKLIHINKPYVDSVESIIFELGVRK